MRAALSDPCLGQLEVKWMIRISTAAAFDLNYSTVGWLCCFNEASALGRSERTKIDYVWKFVSQFDVARKN